MSEKYTPEEQAANRKTWVDALRSGNYEQIGGELRGTKYPKEGESVVGFCCLGVACELAVEAGVAKRQDNSYGAVDNYWDDHRATALPIVVADWLGIHTDGELQEGVEYNGPDGEDSTNTLIGLNDSAGWSFAQIADVIDSGKVRTQEQISETERDEASVEMAVDDL